MPSLTSLSKTTRVHLVFLNPDGSRVFFVRTDQRLNSKKGVYETWPLANTDPHQSRPMALEMAVVAQSRFRALGLTVRMALDPNRDFIDQDTVVTPQGPWPHADVLVTVDEQGNLCDSLDAPCVYLVRAVFTPNGPRFCLRFENGLLQNQPIFVTVAEGPEVAVRIAIERGFTKLEKPLPNPYLERRRQQAERQAAEATRPKFRIRVGDL
jgi:hypothetical protein